MTITLETRPSFSHLADLTTSRGLYEHALFDQPRPEHGYCVDDAARAVVLLCREPSPDGTARQLFDRYLNFTIQSVTEQGACHNRMNDQGQWTDEPGNGDWWGRAMWALGVSAVHAQEEEQRTRSLESFRVVAKTTSPHFMANTFAALGAGEVLLTYPTEVAAKKVLVAVKGIFISRTDWPWPQPRLRYSNGSIAEAAMLTGLALQDTQLFDRGLSWLDFLISLETRREHFSVAPVRGRGPGEKQMGFDQQPIELAAIADACERALTITNDSQWLAEINRAWNWFLGDNDVGVQMFDADTDGGYDGLQRLGPNQNQGAESTIAMLSTAQRAYQAGQTFDH